MRGAGPGRVSHVTILVVVLDSNDNAPLFVNAPYVGVVPLDTPPDSVIAKVNILMLFWKIRQLKR